MKTNPQAETLNMLETLPGYCRHFMDLTLWQPYVLKVCHHHGIKPASIRTGLAGTYPTFIVDDSWVVKFFGRLFDGQTSYEVELRTGNLLEKSTEIPMPRVLHTGHLVNGHPPWNYIIFEFIAGDSIGAVYSQVSFENKRQLAKELGCMLKKLHHHLLQDIQSERFPRTSHQLQFLLRSWVNERQKKHETGLPPHLTAQLSTYLERNDPFFPTIKPYLIHADVTRDHILGSFCNNRWEMHALIDFGDVMHGNIFYELAALHLDVFDCDKRLLNAFLEAYGLVDEDKENFAIKCMLFALQHQFDVFSTVFERHPSLFQIKTLEDLSSRLWTLDVPGCK